MCNTFDKAHTGKGIKDVTTSRCLLCGAAQDSFGHYLAECAYLQPLRSWLSAIWHTLCRSQVSRDQKVSGSQFTVAQFDVVLRFWVGIGVG